MFAISLLSLILSFSALNIAHAAGAVEKLDAEISTLLLKREQLALGKFSQSCTDECKSHKSASCFHNCLLDSSLGDSEWVQISGKIQELNQARSEAHEAEMKAEGSKIKAELDAISLQMKQVAQKYEGECKHACKDHADAEKCTDDCVFEACLQDKEWKSLTKMRHDLVFGDE